MTISGISFKEPARLREPRSDRNPRLARHVTPALFTALVLASLIIGWLHRDDGHLTPERGLGYWLGIGGGTAMLLLLFYPLRKRMRFLGVLGSIPNWFRIHMVLGIIGPVLILFHANFKLGSANSNVALFSMLAVAGSGIVGRYLYGKIHLGLYGRKASVADIIADAERFKSEISRELPLADHLMEALNAFSADALKPAHGVISGGIRLIRVGSKARRCRRQLLNDARAIFAVEASASGWPRRVERQHLAAVRQHLDLFFAAVRRAAAFVVYERLFSQWHVLHLPLFFLLILTTILHVIAVHTF